MKPKIPDAIKALDPDAIFIVRDGVIEWHKNALNLTDSQIQSKLAELQAAYAAQAYSRSRQAEYPSLQDCIHAILDNDLDALQLKRQAVKAKYPKP